MISIDPDKYLIRDAFQRFYPDYLLNHPNLPSEVRKTADSIMKCKTGELGFNISYCEDCGKSLIHAVSCNNRSCPCCQASLSKKWEMERNTELVEGISYYHVVFTVPHELNRLIQFNRKLLLDLLFRCVHETLLSLCADLKFMGAKPGIVSVLHTWGQTLSFHPHIHVCISGGGLTASGQFVETRHKGFFLPEAAIASMFRGKYLCSLKMLYNAGKLDLLCVQELQDYATWKQFINDLFQKQWLPFVKETFNGKGNAVRYLARYSYRTAISNNRILSVSDENVTFRYKDYADKSKDKSLTVKGTDFIHMYLQHILPSGFHRIRFAGYLCNSRKSKNLKRIHMLRKTIYTGNPYRKMKNAELLVALYDLDICTCPECSGRMIPLPRGMPLSLLPSLLNDLKFAMC